MKALCPFSNLMVEEGGGDWGDVSISGPGFARVALGDVAGGSPPIYTIQLASTDEDEDGLVDWWEINYVGNLTDLSGDGVADFDEDGLSDLDEFEEYGSDPTEADTDNDGLSDSADVAAGASPTEADTDNDGLDDGEEVNDHGSDPAEFDTDGDGVGDGAEIAFNTDPNDAASKPDGLAELNTLSILPTGNYAFLADGQIVNAYVENDGTNSWLLVGRGREGWTWDAAGQGSAEAVSQDLGTPDAFVPASYSTNFINGLITGSNADLTGVEIRIKRASNSEGTAYEEGRWRPLSESVWRWNFDTGMDVEYEVVETNGVQGGQLGIQNRNTRDGELGGNDGDRIFTWPWGGHNNIMGFSFGSAVNNGVNNATSFLWETGDENHAIPYAEIYIRLENPGQVPGEDTDDDGIVDIVEEALVGNLDDLTAGDDDGDGLDSPDEISIGTDPTEADTDGDGLEDGAEITAGADPLNSDTDGDGLSDGAEVATHNTDPAEADTDGDGFSDGDELIAGTDPTDENSSPQLGDQIALGLIAYWPLDGDLTDLVGESDGTLMGGGVATYTTGQIGDGIDLDGVGQYIETPLINEELFDFPEGNGFSVSAWFRVDDFNKSWQCLIAKGEGNRWRIHRRGGEQIITGNGGNADVPAGPTNVNDGQIHHIVLVSDPAGGAVRLYIDGQLESTGAAPNLENNAQPMMIGENPDARNRTWSGLIDDIGIWDRPLTEDEISYIYRGGDGNPIISPSDDDEDGLPDFWEKRFGLSSEDDGSINPENGPDGDPDEDGLSNEDEYANRTDPTEEDTDGDGLNDGDEIAAGVDPLNSDTDGDGLTDGSEVAVHGTDPAKVDTDGDTVSDGSEIAFDTDPNDPESRPDGLAELNTLSILPTGNYAFLSDGQIVNAYVENDGTNSWLLVGRGREGWTWDAAGQGLADSVSQDLGTPDAFVPASYGTGFINGLIAASDADLTGVEIRIKRASNPEGTAYEEGRWRPISESAWRWNFDTAMDVEYEVVETNGVQGGQLGIQNRNTRDGELGGNDGDRIFTWNWGNHGVMGFSFGDAVNNGANNATSFLWENTDENHAIPYAEIYIRLEDPGEIPGDDNDDDGIVDIVEEALVGNLDDLTAGDDDGDGLDSPDEISIHGTDPTEADTDGDGLEDGAEVAAGTNPASGDTDGDGLSDGVETNTGVFVGASDTGTNPTSKDTDSDGFSDGEELDLGTNPVNSNDFPDSLLVYYDFEGDVGTTVTDKGDFGNDGTFSGAVELIAEGAPAGSSPGGSAQFTGGFINVPGIDMNTMIRDFGEGDYTMTCWIKPTDVTGEKFIFGQTNQGIHNGIRNNSYLHQAHWGADTNGATQLAPYLAADEDGWIHAAFVYEGATDQGTIYLDGQQDWAGQKNSPNGGGNLIIGGRNNGDGTQYQGLIDEVAVWRSALSAEKILELAEGGSPSGGSRVPLEINNISANFSGASPVVTISFNSKAGRIYAVDRTTDLLLWEELDDGVEGEVESTDFTDSFLPEGSKVMFYRVREVE
ncbi:MAG: hypothetical protein MK183_10075 [Verrucomicrobiales bacterium]|nr:hypothetical protein [Verrucomicrobiales bacterium]